MSACCICGHDTGDDALAIVVNGKERQICDECASMLDVLQEEENGSPRREEAVSALKKKMLDSVASMDVYNAVNEIIHPSKSLNYFQASAKEAFREQEDTEETAETASDSSPIEKLVNFLSVFAVVFLVAGVLMSLIVGFIMVSHYETNATGWILIIAGTLGTILTFAVIMLGLAVAEAVGRMDRRMENIEAMVEVLSKKPGRSSGTKTSGRKTSGTKAPARKTAK